MFITEIVAVSGIAFSTKDTCDSLKTRFFIFLRSDQIDSANHKCVAHTDITNIWAIFLT